MNTIISIIIKLLERVSSEKRSRFDDLEKFNRLSPEVCSALSIPVENAREVKKILKITVDPQRTPSLIRMGGKRNLSHWERGNVYRHGHMKYDRITDEWELTPEPQRSGGWFYILMFCYTLGVLVATSYAIYESPIVTGFNNPADPIFARVLLVLAAFVFAGVPIMWVKMLVFYVEGRIVKKRVREILATEAKK